MNRMHRAVGVLPILILALAACAAPNTGGGAEESQSTAAMPSGSHDMPSSTEPSASASSADEDDAAGTADGRVAIDDVLTDPSAFEGQQITLSENVDEVLVDDVAFLFSGTEVEGQILVVLAPDATIEKEVQASRVVNVTGSLVPFTAEDLEATGVGLSLDDDALAEFEGDVVLVGTAVADPLGG